MHVCSTCGHSLPSFDPLAACRRCATASTGPRQSHIPRIGTEDDDDFGMPGISLDIPGGSGSDDGGASEGGSTREIELGSPDDLDIGLSGDGGGIGLDLPSMPGADDDLGGGAGSGLDLPSPPSAADPGELDLPTPLDDLDLPTPLDELDLPTPLGATSGTAAGASAAEMAPETVDALELDLDVLGDPAERSLAQGVTANLIDAHDEPPLQASSAPLSPPGENTIPMPSSPFVSPAPSKGGSKAVLAVAAVGLLVVAGGGAAYVTGALDSVLGGGEAPVVDTTPKPAPPPKAPPSSDMLGERDPAILAKLKLDTPQGYQQAQAIAEQKGDRVGEGEAVLLRAYRYGPDPVLAAKGLSIAEGLVNAPNPEARRVAGLAALVESKPANALPLLEGDDARSKLYKTWALSALDKHADALAVVTSIGGDGAPDTDDLAIALTLAETQYEAGDDAGREALIKLHEANPDHLGLGEALLHVLIEAGELSSAAELAEALPSIETTSDAHQARIVGVRAQLAMRRGERSAAARLFNEALKRSDNHDLAIMHLNFLNNTGKYRAARQNIQRMLVDKPNDVHLLFEGARADVSAGEGEDALAKAKQLDSLGAALKSGHVQVLVLSMRDEPEAITAVLEQVWDKDVTYTPPTRDYARNLTRQRKFDAAHQQLDAHLERLAAAPKELAMRDRSLSRLHLAKARVYAAVNDWPAAEAAAAKALSFEPNDNDANLSLGVAQINAGARKKGEKTLLRLFERTKGYPGLTTPLGRILLSRDRLEDLEEIIGAQLEDPSNASEELVITGARLRLQQGKLEQALKLVDSVLAINSVSWEAHLVKGQVLLAKGDFAGGLLEFEIANPSKPSAELEMWRGQGLEYNLRAQEATAAYKKALTIDPAYNEAGALYGRQLAYAGSPKLALEVLEPVVKRTKKYPYAFTAIGLAKRDLGDYEGAVKAFEQASRLDPRDFEPLYWAGRLHGDRNQHKKAINALRRARKIARPDEAYYFDMLKRLGRAHEADESPESARKIYEEYVAKAPDGDAGLPSIRRRLERL